MNLLRFLSFSIESKYTENEFKDIYKYIPFEYFILEEGGNESYKYIEIRYLYPIIREIFEEIYSVILLRKDFNNIFNSIILEGGSRGTFLEKIIIHNFTSGEHNDYSINFFDDFLITKKYLIPKYIHKINEKIKLKGNNTINILKKSFLFKQKNFGGKALDIVIVKYFGNYTNYFCFQITGHKKVNNLMTYKELETNLKRMKNYLKNFFDY